MENPAFNLVRQILRSPLFLAQSTLQQQVTLDEILKTGEITRQEVFTLINEAMASSQQLEKKSKLLTESKILAANLEKLDYNTFLTLVISGNIRGEKLLALCSGSDKLNGYCNRSFQLLNNQGLRVGEAEDQYLFRVLLDRAKISVSFGKTPRKTYIDKMVGGRVLGFGGNGGGELGLGNKIYQIKVPTLVPGLNNIVQTSCGLSYSLCLNNEGRVWAFGLDNYGQLGLGSVRKQSTPTLIVPLQNIIQVCAGEYHSLCLDNQGRVWSFGYNSNFGQLGLGDLIDRNIPTLIPNFRNIVQVSTGSHHSICLDNQGRVWSFGLNGRGQLGLGDLNDRNVPTLVPNLNNIVQISARERYNLCLDNQGKVWGFGSNSSGELGLGDSQDRNLPNLNLTLNNIVQVEAGGDYSLCLDNQGRVWGFGSGGYGKLNSSNIEPRLNPVLIPNVENIIQVATGSTYSLCLNNQGQVLGFGYNQFGQLGYDHGNPLVNPNLHNIIQISAGTAHTLCITGQ